MSACKPWCGTVAFFWDDGPIGMFKTDREFYCSAACRDAGEPLQQATLPAVGGAAERQFCTAPGCTLHEAFAEPAPPPPVSGSPQAGTGRPCKPWCGSETKPAAAYYKRGGLYYCRDRCVRRAARTGRTPSSRPVDPSDPTRGPR